MVAIRLICPSRVAGGPGPSVEVPMSGFEWVVHAGRTWQVCHEGPEPDSGSGVPISSSFPLFSVSLVVPVGLGFPVLPVFPS